MAPAKPGHLTRWQLWADTLERQPPVLRRELAGLVLSSALAPIPAAMHARMRRIWKGAATYWLKGDGSITCLVCGSTSHHPKDTSERYCGACHRFHERGK